MENNIVCLDAGHGGSDPGACFGKLIEKNIVLVEALTCRNALTEHGVQVIMTRTIDEYVGLSQRAAIANNAKANYFVSIHCNAGGGDRGEVINSIYRGKGLELSNKIASEMKAIGQDTVKQYDKKGDGGTDYYAVIRETNMDAVIVECAFLDNTTDNQIIDTVAEQEMFGVAIAKGILKQLGIGYKGATQQKPSKPSTPVIKEEKKVDYIIQYSNPVDQNIAEVMADRLNCPTINCLRPYAYYGMYKTVIAVGEAKNKSGHTNVLIQGNNRQDTLDKAIAYCKSLGI
ncbi:N-acetylmuramoyl-L-alanine amidase [Clostridium sp.]|uniref:N-acetylmuramoyl-L-alanine amidase n=1 Tax=Clostridium sp. TaxID=1506 RepID=UPI00321739AE